MLWITFGANEMGLRALRLGGSYETIDVQRRPSNAPLAYRSSFPNGYERVDVKILDSARVTTK